MAITVSAVPTTLQWAHFTQVQNLLDPNDRTPVDAVTRFNFALPNRAPRRVDGKWALADPMTLTITPNCQVRIGAPMNAALLSHEQVHYDVGVVTGRALARKLTRLRGDNMNDLRNKLQAAVNLHFQTRAGLLQVRYDRDTRHGLNQRQQRVWKNQMAAALANPRAERLHGYWL